MSFYTHGEDCRDARVVRSAAGNREKQVESHALFIG